MHRQWHYICVLVGRQHVVMLDASLFVSMNYGLGWSFFVSRDQWPVMFLARTCSARITVSRISGGAFSLVSMNCLSGGRL